jgi:hypothetical protein
VAGSAQFTVGTTPTLIAAAPGGVTVPGPVGWFSLVNGSGAIYLGGPNVTSANGAQVAASGTLSGWLFQGDQVWACTATSTSTVGVLITGA